MFYRNLKNRLLNVTDSYKNLLVIVILVITAISAFNEMKDVPLIGDEDFYSRKSVVIAKYISSLFQEKKNDYVKTISSVIDHGWFVPGMSIVNTPLQILAAHQASLASMRIFMIIINVICMYIIYRLLIKLNFGFLRSFLFIIFCSIVPLYRMYIATLWGDLVGAQLALIVLLHFEFNFQKYRFNFSLKYRKLLIIGFLSAFLLLVRPQYIFLSIIIFLRVFLFMLNSDLNKKKIIKCMKIIIVILVPIIVTYQAWNICINKEFGKTFMITSTYLGKLWSNEKYVAMASRETGHRHMYTAVFVKVKRLARKNNITLSQQAKRELAKINKKSQPNFNEKITRKKNNLISYYLNHNNFVRIFLRNKGVNTGKSAYLKWNSILWLSLLICGLFAFSFPGIVYNNNYLFPLLLKSIFFLFAMEPFLFGGNSRHAVQMIPILVLLILTVSLKSNFQLKKIINQFKNRSVHAVLIILGQLLAVGMMAVNIMVMIIG